MCSSEKDLNREYVYVRRLVSILTNDDSDKLIVEKLKGKNLTSLLYNAKIIDDSTNMAANKKILSCVIRAIEREKRLCHKRDLEQSWGRKFLSSFNCLYPSLKTECTEFSRSVDQQFNHKMIKHRTLSKYTKTSSTRTLNPSCNRYKNRSSLRSAKMASETRKGLFLNRSNIVNYVGGFKNEVLSCAESFTTEKLEDNYGDLRDWKVCHLAPVSCMYKSHQMVYETILPPSLLQRKLICVMLYPRRSFPIMKKVETAEKRSSSTQTPNTCCEPDPLLPKVPNNIKLQDLLEAASNMISTQDQRDYVRSFLSNVEPPFDLLAGFPPYLKLPVNESEYLVGRESVYGSNSELSLSHELPSQQQDVTKQKEDNVRKYVREMACNPWQDTAESIISGVINESLPHDQAAYSHLGACILKRLGAYPGSNSHKDTRYQRPNLNLHELVLQCTEFFESDAGDTDKSDPANEKNEPDLEAPKLNNENNSVDEKNTKTWDSQTIQNYCFIDSENANNQKVGLLNLSASSLVDLGNCQETEDIAAQGDGSQDRKNLQLREPLKITPSGLEQVGKKTKKAGMFEQRVDKNGKVEEKHFPLVPNIIPEVTKKEEAIKVPLHTATSDKNEEPFERANEKSIIESISKSKTDSEPIPQLLTSDHRTNDRANNCPINAHTAAKPPETTDISPSLHWEPTVAEVEIFDGVGEGPQKSTEVPPKKLDEKPQTNKNGAFREKIRGKKKCNVISKKKASGKNDAESRTCRVM